MKDEQPLPLPPGSWSEECSLSFLEGHSASLGRPSFNVPKPIQEKLGGKGLLEAPLSQPRRLDWVRMVANRLWNNGADERGAFNPCPKPMSMERSHMSTVLLQKRWLAAEKSDGVHMQLVLGTWPQALGGGNFAVLINERFEVYLVRVVASEDYFKGTLIDGELLRFEKQDPETGLVVLDYYRYLGWDTSSVAGKNVSQLNLLKRRERLLGALGAEPYPPLDEASCFVRADEWGVISPAEGPHLAFSCKPTPIPLEDLTGPESDPRRDPRVDYAEDGLTFTQIDAPVGNGTCEAILKFKADHTIDLRVPEDPTPDRNGLVILVMAEHDQEVLASGVKFEMPGGMKNVELPLVLDLMGSEWLDQNRGRIWEFTVADFDLSVPLARMKPMRDRTSDKPQPNNRRTVERTLVNVVESIEVREIYELVRTKLAYNPNGLGYDPFRPAVEEIAPAVPMTIS